MEHPERRTGSLVAGVALIALGALFLMDRFYIWQFGWVVRTWWPSALILIGAWRILVDRTQRWTGPLVLIALGAIFQGHNLRLFDWWNMHQLWPVILIAVGIGILISRVRRSGNSWHPPGNAEAKS